MVNLMLKDSQDKQSNKASQEMSFNAVFTFEIYRASQKLRLHDSEAFFYLPSPVIQVIHLGHGIFFCVQACIDSIITVEAGRLSNGRLIQGIDLIIGYLSGSGIRNFLNKLTNIIPASSIDSLFTLFNQFLCTFNSTIPYRLQIGSVFKREGKDEPLT